MKKDIRTCLGTRQRTLRQSIFPQEGKTSGDEPSIDLHGGLGVLLLHVDVHRRRSAIFVAFAMHVAVDRRPMV